MDKKLDFNENDLLNATWSGIKSLKIKSKKDATDANAISKGTSAITKFLEMKHKWVQYTEKNPKAASTSQLFLT